MRLRSYFILLLMLTLVACEESEMLNEFEISSYGDDHQMLSDFSNRLNDLLTYSEVQAFIKQKAEERFDGDYNFLVVAAWNEEIRVKALPEAKQFGDLFSLGIQKNASNKKAIDIDKLKKKYPLLQIALPQLNNPNDFSLDDNITQTAIIPFESNVERVEIIDADGNSSYTGIYEAPTELTVVVSHNERLYHSIGKLKFKGNTNKLLCEEPEPIMYDGNDYYYHYNSYYEFEECGGGGGGGSTDPDPGKDDFAKSFPCSDSDRESNDSKDILEKMKFHNRSDHKKVSEWFDGGLEIHVNVTFAMGENSVDDVKRVFHGRDSEFSSCPFLSSCRTHEFEIGTDIVTWQPELQGSNMKYTWIEKDSGSKRTLEIKFTNKIKLFGIEISLPFTVTNKWEVTNGDDEMGEAIVEYCDDTSPATAYDTGMLNFWVKQ